MEPLQDPLFFKGQEGEGMPLYEKQKCCRNWPSRLGSCSQASAGMWTLHTLSDVSVEIDSSCKEALAWWRQPKATTAAKTRRKQQIVAGG